MVPEKPPFPISDSPSEPYPAMAPPTVDLISALPDSVLHLILSRLPSRQAVQTSVLSPRWRHLWASMPSLALDIMEFGYDDDALRSFGDMALLLRAIPELRVFRVLWHPRHSGDQEALAGWARHVAEGCSPRVLELRTGGEAAAVPDCVFACETLEHMELTVSLRGRFAALAPAAIRLPCLRKLYLGEVRLDQGFMEALSAGCPVLSYLVLDLCSLAFSDISSRTLSHLVLWTCHHPNGIRIEAPNLRFLEFSGVPVGRATLSPMPALRKASFSFGGAEKDGRCMWEQPTWALRDMMENLLPESQTFSGLKNLTLQRCKCINNFLPVDYLLQHSPNVEILHLQYNKFHAGVPAKQFTFESSNASFQCPNLKMSTISCFGGDETDVRLPQLVHTLQERAPNSSVGIRLFW